MAISNTIRKTATNSLAIRARDTLENFKTYQAFGKVIEEDKEYFRNVADDEGLIEIVPGVGKIQVKKPSEGKTVTALAFSEAAFNQLDATMRNKLQKLGVVTKKTVTTKPSLAAVVITLNA